MKIIQLVESLDIGGLPNYVIQLSHLLKNSGYEVSIGYIKGTLGIHLEMEGLDIFHLPDVESLEKLSPELVHVHLLSDIDYLEDLKKSGIAVVRSFHDYTSTCLRRGKRRFEGDRCQRALNYGCVAFGCLIGPSIDKTKLRLPRIMNIFEKIKERDIYISFDAAVCGSHHMEGMLLKNGFVNDRVNLIPYFSKFENEAKNANNKTEGAGKNRPFELLFSGQAVKGKGLEILIEAMVNIEASWHLTVFSEGPRLNHAKELVKNLDLDDKISFMGWVEQSVLKESYNNADLFVLPSIWDDPGPLVGIEALACGTPVVGFAVGGIPDYVINNQTGFLVTDISVSGLHKSLVLAMSEQVSLIKFSSACKEHVNKYHGAIGHLEKIRNVYKNITT